jgi:hypothetical protein
MSCPCWCTMLHNAVTEFHVPGFTAQIRRNAMPELEVACMFTSSMLRSLTSNMYVCIYIVLCMHACVCVCVRVTRLNNTRQYVSNASTPQVFDDLLIIKCALHSFRKPGRLLNLRNSFHCYVVTEFDCHVVFNTGYCDKCNIHMVFEAPPNFKCTTWLSETMRSVRRVYEWWDYDFQEGPFDEEDLHCPRWKSD